MNRGVEIASEVADGPYSVILDQVTNGVAVRMAVLYLLSGARRRRRDVSRLLIKGGRVIDPGRAVDGDLDLLIEDGARRAKIDGARRAAEGRRERSTRRPGGRARASSTSTPTCASPGGRTRRRSRTRHRGRGRRRLHRRVRACRTPSPVNDSRASRELILLEARAAKACARVYPIGAITRARRARSWRRSARCAGRLRGRLRRRPAGGERRADAPRPANTRRHFDLPVIQHCRGADALAGRRA